MWANGYNTFGGLQQRDLQPSSWLTPSMAGGLSNPFGMRFDNYLGGMSNPFAGQSYGNSFQPYNAYGYQYRGW